MVRSRLAEYLARPGRLNPNGAIRLQPLTPAQIEAYLSRIGPALDPLRTILPQDEGLAELAQSPLMLNMMCLAYQGMEATKPIEPPNKMDARYHLV